MNLKVNEIVFHESGSITRMSLYPDSDSISAKDLAQFKFDFDVELARLRDNRRTSQMTSKAAVEME